MAGVGLALTTLVVWLALGPHAHSPADPHPHSLAPALALLLTFTLGAGLAAWRARHAVVLGLVALLTVFTVEAALHSVHHLGNTESDASCVVGGATAHLSGITASSAALGAPVPTLERTDERVSTRPVPFRTIRPREGRAPPIPVLG